MKIWRSFHREDVILASWVGAGITLIVMVCLLAPVVQVVVAPIIAAVEKNGVRTVEKNEKGIFHMGRILFSLGTAQEFIDSEIDLEYDSTLLNQVTREKVSDKESADSFFESKHGIIKDAMLMQASDFSSKQVAGHKGLETFKSELVDSINNQLSRKADIVTALYFRKFMMMPADEY